MKRRDFVKGSLALGASLMLPGCATSPKPFSRIPGANEDVRVAAVGVRTQGSNLIECFRKVSGVRVVAVCDPDQSLLDKQVEEFGKRNEKVIPYLDIRKLLENPSIDAIVVATPNHWHSLVAIWACQAGKDVYVEKPVCHNIWEGRKLVEAARKYKRIVQAGTQKRSDPGLQEAFEYIRKGNLGRILYARGFAISGVRVLGRSTAHSQFRNRWTMTCGVVRLPKNL